MPTFAKKLSWCKDCLTDEERKDSSPSDKPKGKKGPRNLRVKDGATQQNLLADDIRAKGTDNLPVREMQMGEKAKAPALGKIAPKSNPSNPSQVYL